MEFEDALVLRDDPNTRNRGVQMSDEGLGARLQLPAQRLLGGERRVHIRSDGDLARARRIRCRREMGQIRHHAQVFCVETATLVVRHDPDRSDSVPAHVERDQQPLFHGGLHACEICEIAFRV